MAKQIPRFKELVMNERDQESGDPLIWVRGNDEELYRLQMDDSMLVNFALALLSEAARAAPSPKATPILPADNCSTIIDPEGQPGLQFRLTNGLKLILSLPIEQLPKLRELIADLEVALQRQGRMH